jgi:glycosidase
METAFAMVFTLPGMPYIEYGDEIGMTGHGEPLSYQMMHFALSANEKALHDRVALLASIRAAHSALRNGSYSSLGSTADTLAYKVTNSSESVIVLVNRLDISASVGGIPSGSYTDAITGTSVSGSSVSVLPRSAMILISQ